MRYLYPPTGGSSYFSCIASKAAERCVTGCGCIAGWCRCPNVLILERSATTARSEGFA